MPTNILDVLHHQSFGSGRKLLESEGNTPQRELNVYPQIPASVAFPTDTLGAEEGRHHESTVYPFSQMPTLMCATLPFRVLNLHVI